MINKPNYEPEFRPQSLNHVTIFRASKLIKIREQEFIVLQHTHFSVFLQQGKKRNRHIQNAAVTLNYKTDQRNIRKVKKEHIYFKDILIKYRRTLHEQNFGYRKMWLCQQDRIQRGISQNICEIATTIRKYFEEQIDNARVRLNISLNGSSHSEILNNNNGPYFIETLNQQQIYCLETTFVSSRKSTLEPYTRMSKYLINIKDNSSVPTKELGLLFCLYSVLTQKSLLYIVTDRTARWH